MILAKAPRRRRGFFGPDDRVQELPEGALPCRVCGIAVTTYVDTPVERLTIYGQRNQLGYGDDVDILITRCAACLNRRENAARVLTAHPAVARANGDVALDRLDAAMSILDLLGKLSATKTLTVTDEAVRDLIDGLAAFGGWASFSGSSAAPGVCAVRRWGTVPDAVWEDARRAFAHLVRLRFEMTKPVTATR